MSKKIIALVLLFIGFILNFTVLHSSNNYRPINISMKMNISSDHMDTYQVYYSADESFDETKSNKSEYHAVNKFKTLDFSIPSDAKYIRIDFGCIPSNIKINSAYFEYKNNKYKLDFGLLGNSSNINMISNMKFYDDQLSLTTEGNDPYCLVNLREMKLESAINKIIVKYMFIKKITICVLLDIFLICFYIKSDISILLMRELYKDRKIIINLSINDFKTKYAGSYLGIIWAFIQPIVTVVVYWFVFQVGFRSGAVSDYPYVLWLISGLIPWFFFSDAITGGTNSLIEYSYLVKKVVFKITILPVVKIVSALFVHVFFIAFMIFLFIINGHLPDLYTLQIFYYSFCMIILSISITYATSSIIIFFRDLGQLINIVLQIGMWMTPILWNYTMLPEKYRWILKINPMYYIIEGYRNALINKVWIWDNINLGIYFWIITTGIFIVGTTVFRRLKIHFADVL